MPSRYSKTDSARVRQLVRIKGFEPLSDGSQPPTLSIELNPYMVSPKGLEPLTNGLEIHCSRPLSYGDINFLVPTEGFEPPTCGLRVRSSPAELSGHIIITIIFSHCRQRKSLLGGQPFKRSVCRVVALVSAPTTSSPQLLPHHRTKTHNLSLQLFFCLIQSFSWIHPKENLVSRKSRKAGWRRRADSNC